MQKKLKLVGYSRVSRLGDRDLESLRSPEQQRDAITAWAKANGHEVVWLEPDLDESGKNLERPSMQEALRMIREGEADGIVGARLDRITRSIKDLDYLMRAADAEGWALVAIDLNMDNSTANGKLVWGLMGTINEWYLNRSREEWTKARVGSIRRGNHLGSVPPYGYRKRPEDGRLEPDPLAAHFATEIIERRAAGQSLTAIIRWLTEAGARTKAGVGFTTAHVGRIIKNEVYTGVLIDRGSGERLEGAHPPLVDRLTWEAAQARHGVRWGANGPGPLLSGLARCASCRYVLRRDGGRTATRSQDYLGCSHHLTCPRPAWVRISDLTKSFRDGRDLRGLDNYVVDAVFERLPELEAEAFGADSEIEALETAAKLARSNQMDHAADLGLLEAMGREAYMIRSEALRAEADAAEAEFTQAMRKNAGRLQQPVRTLREDWEQMSQAEKREFLATVIQAIFVRSSGKRGRPGLSAAQIKIVWANEPAVDLPRQGRRDYVLHPFVFPDADDPDEIGEVSA